MQDYFPAATAKSTRTRSAIRSLCVTIIAIACFWSTASACLRPTPDKRAIQWSDAIVYAKLRLASARGAGGEQYNFVVVTSLEGKLKAGEEFNAIHTIPGGNREQCAGTLTSDDENKTFLVLLRSTGREGGWQVVTASPTDPSDPTAADAFKQLLDETRKAEAALTDDQIKAQALALANAEDDTEAQHAEDTLIAMGPKALPAVRSLIESVTPVGKRRLEKIIAELTPPADHI